MASETTATMRIVFRLKSLPETAIPSIWSTIDTIKQSIRYHARDFQVSRHQYGGFYEEERGPSDYHVTIKCLKQELPEIINVVKPMQKSWGPVMEVEWSMKGMGVESLEGDGLYGPRVVKRIGRLDRYDIPRGIEMDFDDF